MKSLNSGGHYLLTIFILGALRSYLGNLGLKEKLLDTLGLEEGASFSGGGEVVWSAFHGLIIDLILWIAIK